jgi:hypothetical protein
MTPEKKPRISRWHVGAFTRYVVIPLILVALGVLIGKGTHRGAEAPAGPGAGPAAEGPAQQTAPPQPAAEAVVEASCSFQGNLYPSLMLSLAASYPEYARCLSFTLRNLPQGASVELRVDSALFVEPLVVAVSPADGTATLNPELPWNYPALRRNTQMQPQTFVASLLVDGRASAEASLLCTVHSVNEAVSRVFAGNPGQWQDTSVCFAAFVNEDHPWISTLLSEAIASGTVRSFSGYQAGGAPVLAQVQAVWDALAARGLSYVNVATDSGASPYLSTQYVRFLEQSVSERGANCVDASVLFASVLRRIGLRPVLLFRPGHCFTGFYDAAEGGRIVAFETTLLGSAPFAAAVAEGTKELQTTLPYAGTPQYSVVDIAVCRQQGVSPIPYEPADHN